MTTQSGLSLLRRAAALLVLAGALIPVTFAQGPTPANYFTLTPCRVYDTRLPANAPALTSGVVRTVNVAGLCAVPANATSVMFNLTVVNPTSFGHLRLSPAGTAPPTSTINYSGGQTRANNAIIQLSAGGQVDALAIMMTAPAGTVHLVLDVYGYFVDDVPPVGVDDAATVAEDALATTLDVLGNDTNPDGGAISISAVTQPANGTVAIGPGGANLTYQPNADYCNAPPASALDTFTYDLAPGTSSATVSVTVNCVNDPAVLAGAGTVSFAEDGPPVVVAPALTVADVDDTNLESATVTIANLLDTGAEVLSANTAGTAITASYVAPTLTLTGSDTLANYELVLRSVTYANSDGDPDLTARTVNFVGNDGDADSNSAPATITLTAANDAPVLAAGGSSPGFTEDGPPVAVDPGLTVTDVDDTNLESATVTITNLLDAGAEVLAANVAGTAITANYVAPTLTLTGTDTVANYQQVLRSVTYANSSQNPNATARAVDFVANDGTVNSNTATTTLGVTPVNDPPVLAAGGGAPTFTEDGPAVAVDPGLTVTDVDDTNLESATVTITNLLDAGAEVLAANVAGTAITANYVAPTLTLTGSDTLANYQQVLRSVTYANSSQNPGATGRAIAFVANDGTDNSNTATTTVGVTPVNDAPVLAAGGGSPTFTEGGPAVTVDPGLTVTDVDDTNLESAAVTITNLLDAGAEVLAANVAGTAITASYLAPTLTLTGSDTPANYQQVLRSVTYANSSENPNPAGRTISFTANDGTDNSNTATTTMGVAGVNDAPVLAAGGGSPTFTEDGPAVAVDPALTVTDVDDTNLESATVTITNLLDAGAEVLGANVAGTAITANYVAPTLTLTGSDTLANYQQVLRSVTYANGSQNPSAAGRNIAFQANDGTSNSNIVATVVGITAVNDPPVLTAGGGSPTFTEDGSPVAVDPGLVVVDVDSGSLASATVTITNLQNAGDELLAATTAGTGITASYTAPTLTLTGADSVANYQQVLRSVTYENTSDSPSTTPRALDFRANDGLADSNIVTTTLGVTAVNDAPVLTAGGGSPTFTEDGAPVTVDPALTVTDGDSTDLASAVVTITNLLNPGEEILAANVAGTAITANYVAPTLTLSGTDTLANYQQVLRSVTYRNNSQNPSTTARVLSFRANDGTDDSNIVTTTVGVTAVNDPPTLAGTGTVSFTEDAGAVTVAGALTVADPDHTSLVSGTVTITNLADAGVEVLTANVAGTSITANYVAPTLTLSGTDTLANYQQVLRSVAYNNTSQNPNATPRSLAFVVSDGVANSNTAVATVNVTPVNDPPVFTNPITYATAGHTQLHVAGDTLPGVASIADPLSALVKAAPTDVDGPVAPAVVANSGTTTNGGTFTIDTDGSFTYVPPLNFTGTDPIPYQITDSVTPVSGTINVTVSSVIWYVRDVVDADNAAGGDGRSTDAFESLPPAQTASGIGHFIFVFTGNTVAVPLPNGIILKDGQKLHGQGIGLSVPGFANIVAAGVQPRINALGDAVSVPATAGARNNVEVRGLDLQGTANAVDVTASGANTVSVTISDNTVRGAGAEGLDLNAGSTGLFTATVQNNTIAASGNGFDLLASSAGQIRLDFSGNNVVSGNLGVRIDGSSSAVLYITGFANNVISGNTAGGGADIRTATFDSSPGGSFDVVAAGVTAIGASGNPVGQYGLLMGLVRGNLAFTDLDVYSQDSAFNVSGDGAFTGGAGTQITVTPGAGSLHATNGPAVNVGSLTLDLRLGSLSAANGTLGVSLADVFDGVSVPARFSVGSGSSITNTTNVAFNVGGGNAGISYGGTIANAFGRSVVISGWSGDDATDDLLLSGAIDENGTGILLSGNGGTRTITFSGGLDIDTTAGNIGFSATGNTNTGGLQVTGTNTIDTTNAAALNVTNTVIGTGNLNFQRLSANGGANGVVLLNTGTLGGLVVTGTGAAGTGGVIQNLTGDGISLTNTRSVSLSRMNITNNDGSGINGDDVTGFTLADSSVTNNADTATGVEANIRFQELLGTAAISNTTISGSSEDEIRITPASGVLTNLTISACTIGPNSAATGGNGITVIGSGSATGTLTVTGTLFTGIRASGVVSNFTSTGSHTVNVSGSTFRDNGKGVSLANNTSTDLTFNVSGNTEIVRSLSNALELIASFDATPSMQNSGTFGSNTVGNGTPDSGSRDLHGIAVDLRGDERSVLAVNGNSVRNVDFNGIFFQDADFGALGGAPSDADVTVRDNSIQNIDDNSGFPCGAPYGLLVDMRHATTACLDIFSNTSAESPAACGAAHIRLRQRDTSTFLLERLSDGDGTPNELITDPLTVEAHIVGQNDPGTTADATLVTGFTEAATGTCVKP